MIFPMTRRTLVRALTVVLAFSLPVLILAQARRTPAAPTGTVWTSPTCGCCGKWVEHMTAADFTLSREMTNDLDAVAARQRVPEALRGCHTTQIGRYIVEGHVPADVVQKLLKEQPEVVGIAVPGMPAGSPGMESPNPQPYAVIAFKADGTTYEFARR
jgi:hypothetical protein